MKSNRTRRLFQIGALTAAIIMVPVISSPAVAFSGSSEAYLPNTNIKLQANAWSPTIISGGRFNWATSSKAYQNGARKAISGIKNTATLRVEGFNVSVSNNGVSGGTGASSQTSLSWTNRNTWISDLSGRSSYTGLVWRATVNSAAFGIHQGVKRSVDVWSW